MEWVFEIKEAVDWAYAQLKTKQILFDMGVCETDCDTVAICITELATNILKYAGEGRITFIINEKDDRIEVTIISKDNGPGIENVEEAIKGRDMRETLISTGGVFPSSLGCGLSGVKRLMDEFEILTGKDIGTMIKVKKILKKNL